MTTELPIADDQVDAHADAEIQDCIQLDALRSFFLFAGAGSGKTRSLVTCIESIRAKYGQVLRVRGQQVAVITYTNAACDEIKARLSFDPLVYVSTIHSFVWELISGFTSDIRKWLIDSIAADIADLQEKEKKGRGVSKASVERRRTIESKQKRLELLPSIIRFEYSPTGDNRGRDALSHSEVIRLGASFIEGKHLMQDILCSRFPYLLIDESQDTNGLLMNAFLAVQAAQPKRMALGLFGDLIQRIYTDGKADLGRQLPPDWAKPAKIMNHRCPRRVVKLINKIRSVVDAHTQRARTDAPDGVVRLFVAGGNADRLDIEARVKSRMAVVSNDAQWNANDGVKTLILEHHMAAKRMGFFGLFEPLYTIDDFRTPLRDGTFPPIAFFSNVVLPLVRAEIIDDKFAVARIMRKHSPLLSRDALASAGSEELKMIDLARNAVRGLMDTQPLVGGTSFRTVLNQISTSGIFAVPDSLYPFANGHESEDKAIAHDSDASEKAIALNMFLDTPFLQIASYAAYVGGQAVFGTHQGVKGLEFPRVMVVMDDAEAGGFLFSYDKLFGTKAPTSTDAENAAAGKETAVDRTRRLFYVTCSRSKMSLALVAYSESPEGVKRSAAAAGWFEPDEIESVV